MNRLLFCILWLIATMHAGNAQENKSQEEPEQGKRWTVMALSDEPLPDADILVLLSPPHPKYSEQNFSGEGNWYYSGDTAYTWSEFDHLSDIHAPVGMPTPFPTDFEGGINELGLGEYQEEGKYHAHIIRDENIVYIMDEYLLHIADMSTHVIASIEFYNGLYCSPWGATSKEADQSNVLLDCFDLLYFDEAYNIQFRAIKEPERFQREISQLLNSFSLYDVKPLRADVEHNLDPFVIRTDLMEWTVWEHINDPGPFIFGGIAQNKRLVRYDYETGDHAELSPAIVHSPHAVLQALSFVLRRRSDAVNLHLMSRDGLVNQFLIWNLSNIYMMEETQ